jgi:Ca-activated chloride channel family protein
MLRGTTTTLSIGAALTLGATFLLGLAPAASAADDESVLGQGGGSLILVLDGSGSMKEPGGNGSTRMEEAKKGLDGVIEDLPDDAKVGLRVYGSTISDGPGSCEDTELLVPVDDVDKDALRAGVRKLKPLGNTPIAYSLEQAYEDLPAEGPRSIVLVSDGEENCQGDPCEVAADLKKKGADFYVDVVGLQVDAKSKDQLTCIASAGGGTYYDVKDLDQLEETLTRTSVRAARGYEAAGLPVEGGTSADQATEIEDGQWLDTIGDSGEEHYRLPDPGEGTIHLSAATLPTQGFTGVSNVDVQILDAAGSPCGSGVREASQGASNGNAPIVAAYSLSAADREDCGEGPYVGRVASNNTEVQGLEVLLRTEPGVEDVDALPAADDRASGFSDEVEGEPASGQPVSVIGGPNFSSAPPTVPGTYSDTVLPGETLFYRVPDVGWGQSAVCDATFGTSDQAADAFGAGVGLNAQVRVYGALKTPIDDPSSSTKRQQWRGDREVSVHAASPAVTYRNREATNEVPQAVQVDGDFYCSVTVLGSAAATTDEVGEIPVTLTTSVVGDETGEPTYVEEPQETANDKAADEADGGGPAWWLVAGGVVLLVAVAAALLAALRRRGAGTDDGAGAPPAA